MAFNISKSNNISDIMSFDEIIKRSILEDRASSIWSLDGATNAIPNGIYGEDDGYIYGVEIHNRDYVA